ncbi:MAG: alpha-ketoacid dehydrogenase subunit beta [Planctomycetota bacterium]|nr:alpha-ketoacid dehydrogenase subunit beta [Planctomycetota bacterium]
MESETTPEATYLEAIARAHRDAMRDDPTVFLMGQDVADYGGAFKLSVGLKEEFGAERVINTPIAESGTIGMAVGAALLGRRPVVEMQFADFVSCGFNQVVNVAAKIFYRMERAVPLVLRLPCGGGVAAGPFHSQSPESWFLHVPGIKVVVPAFPGDAYELLRAAIRDPNPVLYLEHKVLYRRIRGPIAGPGAPGDEEIWSRGVRPSARVVRPGSDVTVISYGWMLHRSLEAADLLRDEGIAVEVIDLRVLAPLDTETLKASVRKTGKVLVVHEAPRTAGFGGEIAAMIAEETFEFLDAPPRRLAYPETPVPFHRRLEDASLPDPVSIARVARELHRW